MALNKSKGNMYDFITHTWNPLAGECTHGCQYCSTNKLKKRYPAINSKYSGNLRLVEKELKTNLGKDNFIFVCAQNDLFAEEISNEITSRVLTYLEKFDSKYLFQTKNPEGLIGYLQLLPEEYFKQITPKISHGSAICTTIETNRWYSKVMRNSPHPKKRMEFFSLISGKIYEKYITIEPIMDFDLHELLDMISLCKPIQVNIGADSGNNNLPEPNKDKILNLIAELSRFTKVVQKDNLKRLLK